MSLLKVRGSNQNTGFIFKTYSEKSSTQKLGKYRVKGRKCYHKSVPSYIFNTCTLLLYHYNLIFLIQPCVPCSSLRTSWKNCREKRSSAKRQELVCSKESFIVEKLSRTDQERQKNCFPIGLD